MAITEHLTTTKFSAAVTVEKFSKQPATATACYAYGADGTRVQKTVSGVVTNYLYDLAGQRIAELSASGGWNRGEVYAGGMHLATYANSTTYFDHGDWLGTERLRLSVSGGVADSCTSGPYGDGQSCTGIESDMHFTGKPRDTEDNLDYFGARYYTSGLGRFVTPDWAGKPTAVPYANYGDPQSLNLYAYVRNNPVSGIDPDGHLGPGDSENKGCGVTGEMCDNGESAAEQAAAEKASQQKPPAQNQDNCNGQCTFLAAGQKGERGKAGKAEGTDNPFKKLKPDPNDPSKVIWKDKDGKDHRSAKPGGFDDYWKAKHPDKGTDTAGKKLQEVGSAIVETAKEHPVATGAVVVGVTILTFGAATPEEIILLGAGTAAAGAGP